MTFATVLAGECVIAGAVEVRRNSLMEILAGDTIGILAREFLKVVNTRRHLQTILGLDRGVGNNVEGTAWGDGREFLEFRLGDLQNVGETHDTLEFGRVVCVKDSVGSTNIQLEDLANLGNAIPNEV